MGRAPALRCTTPQKARLRFGLAMVQRHLPHVGDGIQPARELAPISVGGDRSGFRPPRALSLRHNPSQTRAATRRRSLNRTARRSLGSVPHEQDGAAFERQEASQMAGADHVPPCTSHCPTIIEGAWPLSEPVAVREAADGVQVRKSRGSSPQAIFARLSLSKSRAKSA